MSKKICIILGTRPEIIKLSPIIRECEKIKIPFFILHTNQHYSENLDFIFFRDLNLPKPKYNLNIGSGTHAEETGKMLIGIEKILIQEKPRCIIILGDTNTTLAGALAAIKIHIPIVHIESGARSYFRQMPEEINRIIIDHISNLLFTSVHREKKILLSEGIPSKIIFVAGNPIVDAVKQNLKIAKLKSKILTNLKLSSKKYFLVTAHRQENVDQKNLLKNLLQALESIHRQFSFPIIYPLHPRTQKRISEFNLNIPPGIKTIEPLGYLDFLNLEANSLLNLTDSGGVQEESGVLQVPCVSLRENSEWPESIKNGSTVLAGTNPKKILSATNEMLKAKNTWETPLGNGHAAKIIIKIIKRFIF